jgi:hypothetical protein
MLRVADDPADGHARHDAGRIIMMRSFSGLAGIRLSPMTGARLTAEVRWAIMFAFFALCICVPARAHIGPPYPIMQNRKVGPFNVEVWSNPDVGTGSFYIIVDPPKGSGIAVPADMKVQVAVQPVSKRLPVVVYDAWREKLLDHVEFKTLVPFDKEETWHVRITFTSSTANGEADTDVPVTPTLLGRWDLLLFLLPFVGIGVLWFKAATVKRSRGRRRRTTQTGAPQSIDISSGAVSSRMQE